MYSIVRNKYIANINGENVYSLEIVQSGLTEKEVIQIREELVKAKLKMKRYIEDEVDFNSMDGDEEDEVIEKYDGCYVIPMTPIDTFGI